MYKKAVNNRKCPALNSWRKQPRRREADLPPPGHDAEGDGQVRLHAGQQPHQGRPQGGREAGGGGGGGGESFTSSSTRRKAGAVGRAGGSLISSKIHLFSLRLNVGKI